MTKNYIVTFAQESTDNQIADAKQQLKDSGGEITQEYDMPGMRGFSASIPDEFFEGQLKNLKDDGVISGIEVDGEVTTQK